MSAPSHIRKARPGDESAIAIVSVASRRASRRGLYDAAYLDGLNVESLKAEVQGFLQNPPDGWHIWVSEEAKRIVAFAKAGPWKAEPGSAFLEELYVDSDMFRQGVGRRLLYFVENELRAAGFHSAFLWVVEEAREAQAFYLEQGWLPVGRTKELLLDRPRVAQLWQKTLS